MTNIKRHTEAILSGKDNYKILTESIRALHDIYFPLAGIAAGNITDADIVLPAGRAISPIKAAHCLLDFMRTAVFLRGIHKAILQLQKDFPGQTLNILYAGCGPYATLITPFTSLFSSRELSFNMLDISPTSLDAVRKLYDGLGISDYINELVCIDASVYEFPKDKTIHLVISETMQAGLIKEPQVAVMLNLIPQMADKTIFIPEEIDARLQLLDLSEENRSFSADNYKPKRIDLGTLYSISRHNCKKHVPLTITMPAEIGKFTELTVVTNITVFEDEKLAGYDCQLNLPQRLEKVKEKDGRSAIFQYIVRESPGFIHEWLN